MDIIFQFAIGSGIAWAASKMGIPIWFTLSFCVVFLLAALMGAF